MQLAHIVPTSLLEWLPDEQTTHLVLSELILTNEDYFRFYEGKRNDGHRIILDNPVHEDHETSLSDWLSAVERIQPAVAIIPDVIDSAESTIAKAQVGVDLFCGLGLSAELMAVPHGETQVDWVECAQELAKFTEITWFGISLERRFKDDPLALTRRRERVEMLFDHNEFNRLKLHLLGISESGIELGEDGIWGRASSADTSKYAVWYLQGHPVLPPVPVDAVYPGRTILGGSYGYFGAQMTLGRSKGGLRRNLRSWNVYAERNDGA
jgi:hypothetical protein